MVLFINRNTRTSKGHFIVNEIEKDRKGRPINNKKKYPVKMEHNKIIPTKPISNDKLKKKLKTLNFLYNMEILKILKIIKMVTFHTILMYLVIPRNIN